MSELQAITYDNMNKTPLFFWSLTLHYPKSTVALLPAPITVLSSGIKLWTVTIILERAPVMRTASQSRKHPSCSSYQPRLGRAAGLEGEVTASTSKMSNKITSLDAMQIQACRY